MSSFLATEDTESTEKKEEERLRLIRSFLIALFTFQESFWRGSLSSEALAKVDAEFRRGVVFIPLMWTAQGSVFH